VQATVTVWLHSKPIWLTIIQQGAIGIYVTGQHNLLLKPGDRVEVIGRTTRGEFAPTLEPVSIRRLSAGPLPVPLFPPIGDLTRGRFENVWVELRGRLLSVQAHGNLWPDQSPTMCVLRFDVGGVVVRALLAESPPKEIESLVGSIVRIREG
jgi:hypothetical protein